MTIVVFTGIAFEDSPQRQSELEQARAELQDITRKIEAFKSMYHAMDAHFFSKYPEEVKRLGKLKKELIDRANAMAIGKKFHIEDEPEEQPFAADMVDEDGNATEELKQESVRHEEENLKKVPTTSRMKKLYRDIASKCHPDKTKRPELQELFKRAARAYRSNNLPAMVDVWTEVQYLAGSVAMMLERLAELQKAISTRRSDYATMLNAPTGQLLILFSDESTRHVAESRFINYTIDAIQSMESQIMQLAAMERRKFQKVSTSFFNTF